MASYRKRNIIKTISNGKGVLVAEDEEENMLRPSLVFGHLQSSFYYDDEGQLVVGGCEGHDERMCNIFSTSFELETGS